ncbi:hypothetical protein FHR81_002821 [Actinoalloteichus hoggarensis]|nr:hypothetical protein [Actinoalloteichus hoggarensis]
MSEGFDVDPEALRATGDALVSLATRDSMPARR